ncbi:MAG TPA: prolipoprotein diacylglyceryl transferase, partial [Bacteroidota bacterium]|nr:prolipoprotein diacylglyceryl transferase [Bacteroidota bacterium]
ASYLLTLELKRVNLNVNIASEITTIALIFGIIGAKLFHLFEYWDEFINDPLMAFSPAGLTFYGGFLLATLAIFIYIKRKKLSFLQIADLNAPGLALAYGIARIGCHLSGDGDYGIVSNLPWAYSYAKGTVPTPPGVTVHPTPIYELIAGILIFMFLWSKRKKYNVNGKLFFVYLILTAIARFLVEIIRINPRLLLGLSEAQIISIILIIISIIALIILKKKEQISL